MYKHLSAFLLLGLFLLNSHARTSAGTILQRIDSEHSTASLSVAPASDADGWNVGIGKVSGTVDWDVQDVTKSVFDFAIYPARERVRLFKPDGSLRSSGSADLSRYTVLTFRSSRTERDAGGKLQVRGTLTVTHVERESNTTWSNAYDGPKYGPAVTHSASGEIVFTLQGSGSEVATPAGAQLGPGKISGFAVIKRKDFPGLKAAIEDAIWPMVVEDENCEVPAPKPSMKDYTGAICTGHPVEVTPVRQTPQRFGIDYPGPNEVTAPAAEMITIVLRLNLLPVAGSLR
jgi:polyisoprenoid-binding protein YceI